MGHLRLGIRETTDHAGDVRLGDPLETRMITGNLVGHLRLGIRETADHAGDVRLGDHLETRMITGNPGGAS